MEYGGDGLDETWVQIGSRSGLERGADLLSRTALLRTTMRKIPAPSGFWGKPR